MTEPTIDRPTTNRPLGSGSGKDEGKDEEKATDCSPVPGTLGEVDVRPRGIRASLADDRGMSTIEYALGCVAAAALGALLYMVVTSDSVEAALTGIFERALETK